MATGQLLAYHGDPKIKAKYLARMRAHIKADNLVHGATGSGGKGCAVWCTLNAYDHAAYETQLGIPRILARLEDGIFENLPKGPDKKWPVDFLNAITPGADLSMVWPRFALWMLSDEKWGVLQFANTEQTKKAIQGVIDLYKEWVETGKNPFTAADAAADARWSAAADAADADARWSDAAADARWSAADARWSAAAARWSAAADARWSAAAARWSDAAADAAAAAFQKKKVAMREAQAGKLLELLRAEKPVPKAA